jgi:CubicO group peptidase (beta-lactamase class C family)
MKTYDIPGCALGIVKDDSVVFLKGYGYADDNGTKVTPQTSFLLASVSKSFTALGIMQLVEEGKIDLYAPVQRYLPWFRVADNNASSQITVRQLLNQTSGFSTLDGRRKYTDSDRKETGLEDYVRSLKETQLIATPGQKFEYSNINYGILGLIIQKISEESYETYIQKRIFEPLEMRHSFTSLSDAKDEASRGYYPFFGILTEYDKPLSRAITPWGGLYSGAEDMTHYLIAHLNQGNYLEHNIISPDGIAELFKPEKDNYAMGWGVFPNYEPNNIKYTAVSHSGGGPYFSSFMLLVPETKFGMILLINVDDPTKDSILSWFGWIISEIYFGKEPSYPQPAESFLVQHSRIIFMGVIILLITGFFWSLRNLRYRHLMNKKYEHRLRFILLYAVIPLIIDALFSIYILGILLPQKVITIPIALVFVPDLGIIFIIILLLTLVWGSLRTLLMLFAILKN